MRQLFIDTANLKEITEANEMGVIQGVTTNPSIIAKEPKGNYDELLVSLANYCSTNNLSLSVEVFSTEYDQIIDEAQELHNNLSKYHKNVYVKIPIGKTELKAINYLSGKGIKINCTCCYTKEQMSLAALAGADYVSLFYARLRDIGGKPNEVLKYTSDFIFQNGLFTKIIAGSIRTSSDVIEAWEHGANIATTSFSVIQSMVNHPQTTTSINKFLEDFKGWRS